MFSQRPAKVLAIVAALLGVAYVALLVPSPVVADPCIVRNGREFDWCRDLRKDRSYYPTEVLTYVVQSGDTLWSIAARYDLDVDTLRYSNPELKRNPDVLHIGQEVRILPFVGAIHKVEPGDTLESIAQLWNVDIDEIINYGPNGFDDGSVMVGEELIIPSGYLNLNIPAPAKSPSSKLAWPLRGWLSQRYSASHKAIDIATSYGAPVYAAASGTVVRTGWLFTGYGYSVIINHGNGLLTLYSHLKGPLVRVGQQVKRGQAIGAVGSTGRSTGPHVHLEVRKDGARIDPLPFLPKLPPH